MHKDSRDPWFGGTTVGTTEEAFLNKKLRDDLSGRKELTDLYKQIRIPGLGMVLFDKTRALDQIRSVLAEMKQQYKLQGYKKCETYFFTIVL